MRQTSDTQPHPFIRVCTQENVLITRYSNGFHPVHQCIHMWMEIRGRLQWSIIWQSIGHWMESVCMASDWDIFLSVSCASSDVFILINPIKYWLSCFRVDYDDNPPRTQWGCEAFSIFASYRKLEVRLAQQGRRYGKNEREKGRKRAHSIYINNLYASFVESSIIASFLSMNIAFIYLFFVRSLFRLSLFSISILNLFRLLLSWTHDGDQERNIRRARKTIYLNSTISSNTITEWPSHACRSVQLIFGAAIYSLNRVWLYTIHTRSTMFVLFWLSPVESFGPFGLQ